MRVERRRDRLPFERMTGKSSRPLPRKVSVYGSRCYWVLMSDTCCRGRAMALRSLLNQNHLRQNRLYEITHRAGVNERVACTDDVLWASRYVQHERGRRGGSSSLSHRQV